MSAIRIIDHVTIAIPADAPPDVPSEDKRLLAQVWALVALKRGDAAGPHEIRFVTHSPSGKSEVTAVRQILFRDEPYSGANMRINFQVGIKEGGLFWVDVFVGKRLMTRMPLQITVKRQEATPAPNEVKQKPKPRRKRK